MIYTNFLFFIVAIAVFATAPAAGKSAFPSYINIYAILLMILGFWHFNRYKFMKLRAAYLKREAVTIEEAKKVYFSAINIHMVFALFLFAGEVFLFDLKHFLVGAPVLGDLIVFVNSAGLAIFMLHLAIVWYWAYRAMGDVISLGKSAGDNVRSNTRFNLAIVIPWLMFLLIRDLLAILFPALLAQLESSFLFHVVYFGLFLLIFAIFAPVLISRLWDCKPMENTEIKETITAFCRSRKVRFKQIMSWNALNGGLVTAGVMGLIYPFRYLMITPELMKLLNKDEIMGVVSHEVGHVKKKHLLYYLVFLMGFAVLGVGLIEWVLVLGFVVLPGSLIASGAYNYISIFISLFFFIVYFRFVFGYFMRNFERQADMYCFEAGIDPNHLISSFEKLGGHVGDDGKKSNWHHYNIPQRIGFLRECMEAPQQIVKHNKKVKRALGIFLVSLFIVSAVSFYAPADLNNHAREIWVQKRIEENPKDPQLYWLLGMVSYEMEKWEQAKNAYENALHLEYGQPQVLNNLAWLYLKCPDERLLNRRRALTLAEDAAKLNPAPHVLDTLAEAYFQNSMYEEAFKAARQALLKAVENRKYHKEQLEKMKKFYQKFKSSIKI